MTGADLVQRLDQEAGRRQTTTRALAAQLSPYPDKWLMQLFIAQRPKPATIARIDALIAGEEVPPPPANNFQARPVRDRAFHIVRAPLPEEDLPPAVFRDPCPRCGTRADVGCDHNHVRVSMGAFA